MGELTIGQLARSAGVGVETIRFYERRGLLEDPPRLASGYRQYPPTTTARLRFIRRAKELGFSLTEIRELLSIRVDSATSCEAVERRLEAKVEEIVERIADLRRIMEALQELASTCRDQEHMEMCPVLRMWSQGEAH